MDPQIISWIVSLVAGAVGSNIVGTLFKNYNYGPALNTVLGAVGGGLGGKVLPTLIPALGGLVGGDLGTGVVAAIVGGLLPLIYGFFKKPAVTA